MGANIYGEIAEEHLTFNEKTLWSGGPAKGRDYQGGNLVDKGKNGKTIKEIQELFKEGKIQEASKKCEELVGLSDDAGEKGYGHYLPWGDIKIRHTDVGMMAKQPAIRAILTLQRRRPMSISGQMTPRTAASSS